MRSLRNCLIKINDWHQKRWFIVSLLSTTSGVWFNLILHFFGSYLHLTKYNESGRSTLTALGLILTIITVGWTFLIVFAQRYNDYHNHNLGLSVDRLGKTETTYETLTSSSASIIERGVSEKLNYIEKLMSKEKNIEMLKPIKKPCHSLENIADEMEATLSELLSFKQYNIRPKDIYVNIYYLFPHDEDAQWRKARNFKTEVGLKIQDLLQSNSTFSWVQKSTDHFVYYNSKLNAYEEGHYLADAKDGNSLNGSISCYMDEIIKNDKTLVRFIITMATYEKKFSKSNSRQENESIAYNLKHQVLPGYVILIKSALTDLYITHLQQAITEEQKC